MLSKRDRRLLLSKRDKMLLLSRRDKRLLLSRRDKRLKSSDRSLLNSKELLRKRLKDRRSSDLPRLKLKKSVGHNRLLRKKRKLKSNSNCNEKLKHSVSWKRKKRDKLNLRQKDFGKKKQPDSEH